MRERDVVQLILGTIGAGLATWFGAWAAFRHERSDKARTARDREYRDLNQVLFTIWSQRNILIHVKKEYLTHQGTGAVRAFETVAFLATSSDVRLSIEPLFWFLQENHADLLARTLILNRNIEKIFDVIPVRTELHRNCQALLATQFKAGTRAELSDFVRLAGSDKVGQLSDLTDYLYKSVPELIVECEAVSAAITLAGKTKFPKGSFFTIEQVVTKDEQT